MPCKTKELQREYQKLWVRRRRKEWFDENGPCIKCGSWDDLELDHIDESKKITHRIWSWSKERRDEELAKCQVLCEKCHKEKTIEYINTFKRPLEHGTYHSYKHWDCRCEPCSEALRQYWRDRRARK